ncbi:lipa and NB-ARC domain protein [Aspergillus campestris IBT 28561]|uniref:Lipa and NB-ARC domain protein n=1 Tax=Aspergillus campestris (strain IBT 28561) TaxID=1392248 RepID=A0A2I1CSY4_ASPC2|nr:lipa and NB-ARC domain protein [Aspergillus campestris IBT 28561]PKY00736.1 lipa and NB-ARC domain protein [Aspergillus campestris IBT 28561]
MNPNVEYEYPFLEEVFTPPENSKIDFIFVHGLNPRGRNDHPFETWTHPNGTFWPRDFLPLDVPQARVFVYGYNSNITNPQSMSTASVKDHANTLLNLLDMERSPQMNTRLPKIIFIGHSLGGLVIKQALLNAQEDPKYGTIRRDTAGLVFFGTPHRGTKGVELGKIAAKVARFVSKGHASNDLLDCLEQNSLFTRQMSSRFSHQLEDYKVISFVEGKEVMLGGAGPASISHLVVDEESAVLGLPGNRETRLKLDADHSMMCKVSARGAMYRLIKGNIKQIADQVLVTEQGFITQPSSAAPQSPPPLPPRIDATNSSTSYPAARTPLPGAVQPRVTGVLYPPTDSDPRSIKAAQLKCEWKWDEARQVEYALFQEHLRTLGADHHSTLQAGYNLAEIDVESGYLTKGAEWAEWVSNNSARVFERRHPLAMKAESLMGEILCAQGKYQEGESVIANVLARQQMAPGVGEQDLDTLETRRRLAMAYDNLERRQEAVQMGEKYRQSLVALLGDTHIRVIKAGLYSAELVIEAHRAEHGGSQMVMRFNTTVQQSCASICQIARDVVALLGARHPLSIYSLRIEGAAQMVDHSCGEASETLRRALSLAEEVLGTEHPETLAIVAHLGIMYASQDNDPLSFNKSAAGLKLAVPWIERYLRWAEHRKGQGSPEVQALLKMLASLYFAKQQYVEAQGYYERLEASHRASGTPMPDEAANFMQLCRMNTRYLTPARSPRAGGFESMLAAFQKRL